MNFMYSPRQQFLKSEKGHFKKWVWFEYYTHYDTQDEQANKTEKN